MRTLQFTPGSYYHVYNRGTEKRDLFTDDADYERFMRTVLRTKHNLSHRRHEIGIVAYALMPNHFHFLVRQMEDGGVSMFMERLGNSYAKYFNVRHERSGHLFEAPFKAKLIEDELYLHTLVEYIHQNPKDLFTSQPLEEQIRSIQQYPWSSSLHYHGMMYDPILDEPEIAEIFGSSQPLGLTVPQNAKRP